MLSISRSISNPTYSEFKRFLIGYRNQDIKIKDTPHKSSEFCLIVCLIITHETLERFASNLD